MGRTERVALIQSIERKRNSKVISYITSDRRNLASLIADDAVSIIHDHLLSMDEKDRTKLDLFIYSRGGNSDVPWTLVSMFRQYCHAGSFSVLIPYRAHSAATVISLGADEIVMTKKGELGPIDATMSSGPYNPVEGDTRNRLPVSVEDVNGFFALLDRIGCERSTEKMEGFKQLTDKVHPLALGAVNRLLEETKLVALRLLSTRAKPFSEEVNNGIIRKLSSEVYSHSHAINRAEARKYLGLGHVVDAESIDLQDDIWGLYREYRDLFEFENPFQPQEYLVANNLEEHTWSDLNIACVESTAHFDMYKNSVRINRIRQTPTTINLNLGNVTLPSINIQSIPDSIDPQSLNAFIAQYINGAMQQWLNTAVLSAVASLQRSLPQQGFQQAQFNSGWTREV